MLLNDNIKSIIQKYLTYSDEQIEEFRITWQKSISKTNRLFKVGVKDYYQKCFICSDEEHYNHECYKFYYHVHVINSIILK